MVEIKFINGKAILADEEVMFQMDLIVKQNNKKISLAMDDSTVSDLIIHGIEYLAENNHTGAVRLKNCLIDIALEVGKNK